MTRADIRLAAARVALRGFGIGSHATVDELAGARGVFRVDYDSERFVLRALPAGMSAGARDVQVAWLRAITLETSLYVPRPVATSAAWTMLRWVDGEAPAAPDAFAKPAVLSRVGETAAMLHRHAATFPPAGFDQVRAIDAATLVGAASCLGDGSAARLFAPDDRAVLEAAAPRIAEAIDRLAGGRGLIHADLAPANWVFRDGQPRLIDFDEFGVGPFLFDLLGVLWSHVAWKSYPSMRAALLAGYERVRPLADDERDGLDAVQAATLMPWFSRGCRMADDAGRAEFLKWVPTNVAAVARLCATGR